MERTKTETEGIFGFSAQNSTSHNYDLSLIRETLKGSSQAFAELMALYKNRVEALGMRFFKNKDDTEDFVQDVFIKAYTNLAGFKGNSRFSTWLTRIAFTTAVNLKKKKNDTTPLTDLDMDSALFAYRGKTPEEAQIYNATLKAVKEAVKELPDNYSICLDLYFFHDFSYEEISTITDFPVNTIKSHIFRAKKILREKLSDFSV
jgi:RNA polymerase sigma-70 factor (ECF subfamily)